MAGSCHCEFKGVCSCAETHEFMSCIAASCSSGACQCSNNQFYSACTQMAQVCPNT